MTTEGFSVREFERLLQEQVRGVCEERALNYDRDTDRGFAFQLWVARLFAARDQAIDPELDENVFSTNDCKVDVVLEDPDQKILYFVQCKFDSVASKPSISEGDVNDFFGRHDIFLNKQWVAKNAPAELQFYLNDYEERIADGYQVLYYFVSTGRASDRTKDLLDLFTNKHKEDFPGISFHLVDFYDLKELYVETKTLEQRIPEYIELQLPEGRFIEKTSPHPTILAIVKGNALVSLYKKERERLFAYNIRTYLGRKGINKEIIATARERPKDFYYFNNGISAICTKYEVGAKNVLVAHNFQIINGAQTIGALAATPPNADVEVLLRVTIGESVKTEKGFNADIIKYNNSQSVIKSADFRSNDPINLWLESNLNRLKPTGPLPKITYIRKRTASRAKRGSYALKFEDLAKIRHAYLHEPMRSVSEPKSLWSFEADGGVYERALGVEGALMDFWPDNELREFLIAFAFYIRIEQEIRGLVKKSRKWVFLLRLRFFAVALANKYVNAESLDVDKSQLLSSGGYFDSCFRHFWSEASRVLTDAHQQAVDADKISLYALARSDQRWNTVKEKFLMFLELPQPLRSPKNGTGAARNP